MKKLLIAVLLFASFSTFAVPTSCTITNGASCVVFYQLLVSVAGTTTCPIGGVSTMLALAPGASVSYYSSAVPGVPSANRDFLGARFYRGSTSCATNFIPVGNPCTGYGLTASQIVATSTCASCGVVTATWTPPTNGVSLLTFN